MARDGSPKPLLERTDSERDVMHINHPEEDENAPLLSSGNNTIPRYDGEEHSDRESQRSVSTASGVPVPKVEGRSWASITAIIVLSVMLILIIISAFILPSAVEEYATRAMVIEPRGMSIDSFTRTSVKARVQADFHLDASRCKNSAMRNIGRFGMYIAHHVESEPSEVKVFLPEYDDMHVGTAKVPKMKASVRNGEVTRLDFVADVKPGKTSDLQRIADDFVKGRMGELTIKGMTDVHVRCSWLSWIPLGTTELAPTIVLEGRDVPGIPARNITKLNIKEVEVGKNARRRRNVQKAMMAEATIEVENNIPDDIPLSFTIPPLSFDILVDGCAETDAHIMVATSSSEAINIEPQKAFEVNANSLIRELPESFTEPCPNTELSPLDTILADYIQGKNATLYVRGARSPHPDTPEFIANFLKDITVPIPVTGHSFVDVVKDFDIKDVHFGMPDPFADPKSPESNPRISGTIMTLVALPKEANFSIDVNRIRATADVFHKGKKMGVLELKEWQKAKAERIDGTKEENAMLMVSSKVKNAPLKITDQDVFSDVIEKLLYGKEVMLGVKALVDMEIATVLGALTVKNVPGNASVPIKAPSNGGHGGKGGLKDQLRQINPQVFGVDLVDTSETSLVLEAKMNFTNPTNYTATVPYFNVLVLSNGSVIGSATVQDLEVKKGNNSNAVARILWDPVTLGDEKSPAIARMLLSQYISGWNTTMTFKTHKDSVPGQPALGEALSRLSIEMPMPHLSAGDGNGDGSGGDGNAGDRPHFIQSATIHLFSSTAVFSLLSPFTHTAMWMEAINATAFYNHTEVIGTIEYELPFKIPPGTSESPRLPVDWDPSGVGYQKMKEALNDGLKVAARADAKIRLGNWRDTIWFEGDGIGAKVRL